MDDSENNDSSNSTTQTIAAAAHGFIKATTARNANTGRAYSNGLSYFLQGLSHFGLDPETAPVSELKDDHVRPLLDPKFFEGDTKPLLAHLSVNTQHLYTSAVLAFFDDLILERQAEINLTRVRALVRRHLDKRPEINPMAHQDDLRKLLAHAEGLHKQAAPNQRQALINYRDQAFLLTLADTGLRVHEACGLQIKDIDFQNLKGRIVGKGEKTAYVRFSARAMQAIRDYLHERNSQDSEYRREKGLRWKELPVFARHDKGAGSKVLQLSVDGGRHIVDTRVSESLGDEYKDAISPHTLRHHFVTTVLHATGNMRLAQLLARHSNASTTEIYAHLTDEELDRAHYEVFNQ